MTGRGPLHRVTWLLSRLAPESERDALMGDLAEEYALRAKAASSSAAEKWYRLQIFASVLPLLWARLRRPVWLATFGVALAAYVAVGVVELLVRRVISGSIVAYDPLALVVVFPMVVFIGYFAARIRRRSAMVLAAMMLLAVTVMTLTTTENVPLWYRIAYFFVGPAAACIGSALRSAALSSRP